MLITRHPARRTGTSVATLLIGFFVAGCNDGNIPSEPGAVIPTMSAKGGNPGKPGGGGGGGGGGGTGGDAQVLVTVAGGMNTGMLSPQLMKLKESQSLVRLNAYAPKFGDPYFDLAISMINTESAGVGACAFTGKTALDHPEFAGTLFAKLRQSSVAREVLVRIDKTALVNGVGRSEDNIIWSWFGAELPIRVEGAPRVTVVGEFTGNFTATFSGGTIELKGTWPGERTNLFLTCPILDDITLTVARS